MINEDFGKEVCAIHLNLDLGERLTGIESAALLRAKLLKNYLNIDSLYISNLFNARIAVNQKNVLFKNLGCKNLNFINIFDYFTRRLSRSEVQKKWLPPDDQRAVPLEDGSGDMRLYKDGEFSGYVKKDSAAKQVLYINYLRSGKIWKRDWFAEDGSLYRSEYISPSLQSGDASLDMLYRPDGSLALIREFEINPGSARSLRVAQYIEDGSVKCQFDSEGDLLLYFLKRIIDPQKINILFIDRTSEYLDAVERLSSLMSDCIRVIPIIHNTHYAHSVQNPGDPYTSPLSTFYKKIIINPRECDAVLCLTREQEMDIRRRVGDGPFVTIPHALEVPVLTKNIRNLNAVVMLARFAEEKQHKLALRAFALVLKKIPNARLVLYGYGDKLQEIHDEIHALNIENSVSIKPFNLDVASILQRAGLMLCSSRNEGFSISILESLMHGCPVVSFACRYGPSDMIQDGINGRLCKPQDVEGLAKAMVEVMDNPAIHLAMIRSAQQSVEAFSAASVAQRWGRLINGIVRRPA